MPGAAPPEPGPSPIPRPAESAARHLHPSGGGGPLLDTSVLSHIAKGLAEAVESTPAAPAHVIERVRLLATEGYDAWLMVWGPGATLESHDHDGSIGVMHVIQGSLLETTALIEGDELTPLRRLEEGSTSEFAAAVRHALFNPGSETTVTLGVYSPPLGPSEGDGTHSSPN